MQTTVKFLTNIDCCKRFMNQNSGLPLERINPLIGDYIRVYHDTGFEVSMKVVERKWVLTNGTSPELHVWLASPNGFSIPEFEKVLKDRGFPIA